MARVGFLDPGLNQAAGPSGKPMISQDRMICSGPGGLFILR